MEGRGMSKKQQSKVQKQPESQTISASDVPERFYPRDSCNRRIMPERFCPICWNRFRGYGTKDKTSERGTGYYKCNRTVPGSEFGPCGFTWSWTFEEVESIRANYLKQMEANLVTHREVIIEGRR